MKGMIAWFAKNPVAANLIMITLLVGGAISINTITKEFFPDFSLDMISVSVPYRGAAPEEVEEGIVIRIEEAIQDLEGIKKITSTASENVGSVMIELESDADNAKMLDDVKSRVDAIDTFPEEAEKPVIEELDNLRQVISVAVAGSTDEKSLKRLAERVRDEIMEIEGITLAEIANARPYEVSIEVSEEDLRRYGLTFDDVANAVRRSSLDVPGGLIKTPAGEVQLRTEGQAYIQGEFESIPLITRPDGTRLYLRDVAAVVDGFEDTDQSARFNGQPAIIVDVFRVGDQSILDVADKVIAYVEETKDQVPAGISLYTWQDQSIPMEGRINILMKNGLTGLLLVFIVLALFLRFRLAFWVTIGIPISFAGAFMVMPLLDVSINMISLFAFIVVLGIVVDDAIIVGENIFTWQERTKKGREGAIKGAQRVGTPVIFAVLTTIAAFSPILDVEGATGKIMRVIPMIVIPTLLFSLVESLLVLPAHLSHLRHSGPDEERETRRGVLYPLRLVSSGWRRFQGAFARGLQLFIAKAYKPSLEFGLEWRYLTIAGGAVTLLVTLGLVSGGFIKFVFFPPIEADFVSARLAMPLGTPATKTAEAVTRLETTAERVRQEFLDETGDDVFKHVLASVGDQPLQGARSRNAGDRGSFSAAHLGEVAIELTPSEDRSVTSQQILLRWREVTGQIPDTSELAFSSSIFSPGEPINVQLTGFDIDELIRASDEVKAQLATYAGVFDISDSYEAGKQEIKLDIKPEAEAVGLTMSDLGRQVRQAFFGEEAQRIQRGRDDVRVMVRYPEESRRSIFDLETMRIRTPQGGEVPFSTVAEASIGRGFASIKRVDRRRAINITADVDIRQGNANEIMADLEAEFLPRLKAGHPSITYGFEGQGREQADTMGDLIMGFVFAILVIYALMAVPFKSYVQPIIVMSAIPFGLVGAIWGHVIMGLDLTILSVFGLVALTGVVVNDSLVMVDFINTHRKEGMTLFTAVREAGVARFRPILLTSLTTFAGLTPLLLERSVQAQFLIPMAVSLGFGVVFATFISLVLVPAGFLVYEDGKRLVRWLYGSDDDTREDDGTPLLGESAREEPSL